MNPMKSVETIDPMNVFRSTGCMWRFEDSVLYLKDAVVLFGMVKYRLMLSTVICDSFGMA